MNMNDFKGTLYDILGYFAPGLFSVVAVFVNYLRICEYNDIFESIRHFDQNISAFRVFVLIIVSYILGHAISSMSSMLIEKCLMPRIKKLNKDITIENILNHEHYVLLCNKYKRLFGAQYNDKNIRKIICYVQAKQSSIYETALIFLSFYGMARNFTLVFLVLSIIEICLIIFNSIGNLYLLLAYILLFTIFLYEYIRFIKYFRDTIASGFLVPENMN